VIKRVLLALVVASSFLIGYVGAAEAWPIKDRQPFYGYFLNDYDAYGDDVWRPYSGPSACQGTGYAIPTGINTKSEFINFVKCKLNNGNAQERVGAQFIIQTMRGSDNGRPTASEIADWEARIMNPAVGVNWGTTRSYTVNSFYQGTGSGANPVDDAFYNESGSSTQTIVFTYTGVDYAIRRQCANPVGNGNIGTLPPAPPVQDFNMEGRSTVNDTTAVPGQILTFNHYLSNEGVTSTSPDTIDWDIRNTISGGVTLSGNAGTFSSGQEKMVRSHTVAVPDDASPGDQICRRVEWSPNTESGGSQNGSPACSTVVAQFNLTPTVQASASTAQDGDSITFTYRVSNSGPTTTTSVTCKPVGNTEGPGYTPLPQQDVDRTSDVGYIPPGTTCPQTFPITSGAGVTVATENVTISGQQPGDKVCRSLVINPKNHSGGFRASAEQCVTIAKTPYVHFMGNDVWAGGGFAATNPACNTSAKIQTVAHTLSDGSGAGSASEYAAFALGRITNFGSSNKALINPAGPAGKALTFSNLNAVNLGQYGAPQHCITDYVAQYNKTPNDGGYPVAINVGSQPDGTQLNLSGSRTFSGNMPVGSRQIYLVEGDVTITGNITYPANYNGLSELPSLVVIATGNMTVNRDVTQMDGLFIARGQFFTCDVAVGTTLSVNPPCEKQLTVNGAVVMGQLQLLRTFGAQGSNNTERKQPAEVFRFNSEMYLRSALTGNNPNLLQTINQIDLPPRF
jgi:hypothetical protein